MRRFGGEIGMVRPGAIQGTSSLVGVRVGNGLAGTQVSLALKPTGLPTRLPWELSPGQRLLALVLEAEGPMARLELGGQQLRARTERPLPVGERIWLEVAEAAEEGAIILKVLGREMSSPKLPQPDWQVSLTVDLTKREPEVRPRQDQPERRQSGDEKSEHLGITIDLKGQRGLYRARLVWGEEGYWVSLNLPPGIKAEHEELERLLAEVDWPLRGLLLHKPGPVDVLV